MRTIGGTVSQPELSRLREHVVEGVAAGLAEHVDLPLERAEWLVLEQLTSEELDDELRDSIGALILRLGLERDLDDHELDEAIADASRRLLLRVGRRLAALERG